MKNWRLAVFIMATLLASDAAVARGEGSAVEIKKTMAAERAAEIIGLRSSLARAFIKSDTAATEETFKSVCGAVGKRVKEISEKDGVTVRHASTKNRNPANAPTADEIEDINRFDTENGLKELSGERLIDGKRFFRYTAAIYVEEACLTCHGAKDKRPQFITIKYPKDKAYDFKTGDLRGIISILAPLD